MEPPDLNLPLNEEEKLATLLRANAPVLPNGDFSVRVLAALPPPAAAGVNWLRVLACLAGATVGTVFAWQQGASLPVLVDSANRLGAALFTRAEPGLSWTWLLALVVAAAGSSLLFALRRDSKTPEIF